MEFSSHALDISYTLSGMDLISKSWKDLITLPGKDLITLPWQDLINLSVNDLGRISLFCKKMISLPYLKEILPCKEMIS